MISPKRPYVKQLNRRGDSTGVSIPPQLLKRLGWNLHDAVALTVVDESLVLTKVILPQVPNIKHTEAKPALELSVQAVSDKVR